MIIYLIRNKINGKRYVGKTIHPLWKRWSGHKGSAKKGSMLPIHCALRKYGVENFEVLALYTPEPGSAITEEQLLEVEISYIKLMRSNQREFGYNITLGGGGISGYKHTDKAKLAISKAGIGRVHSEESRRKISASQKGKLVSEETRQKLAEAATNPSPETRIKMSRAATGKKLSEETRRKMSEARRREWESGARKGGHTFSLSEETRQKMSEHAKNRSDTHRQRLSESLKRSWERRRET